MIEDAMDRIAHTLNIDPVMVNWYNVYHNHYSNCQVREINLVQEGDKTVYGYTLTDCHMVKAWKKLLEDSEYYQRKEKINDFNGYIEVPFIIISYTVRMSGLREVWLLYLQSMALLLDQSFWIKEEHWYWYIKMALYYLVMVEWKWGRYYSNFCASCKPFVQT